MPDMETELRLTGLADRIAVLESTPAAPVQPPPQLATLVGQVQALTTRLTALEATLKAAAKA